MIHFCPPVSLDLGGPGSVTTVSVCTRKNSIPVPSTGGRHDVARRAGWWAPGRSPPLRRGDLDLGSTFRSAPGCSVRQPCRWRCPRRDGPVTCRLVRCRRHPPPIPGSIVTNRWSLCPMSGWPGGKHCPLRVRTESPTFGSWRTRPRRAPPSQLTSGPAASISSSSRDRWCGPRSSSRVRRGPRVPVEGQEVTPWRLQPPLPGIAEVEPIEGSS